VSATTPSRERRPGTRPRRARGDLALEALVGIGIAAMLGGMILGALSGQQGLPGLTAWLFFGGLAVVLAIPVGLMVWFLGVMTWESFIGSRGTAPAGKAAIGQPAAATGAWVAQPLHPSRAVRVGAGIALAGLALAMAGAVAQGTSGSQTGVGALMSTFGVVVCLVGAMLAIGGHAWAIRASGDAQRKHEWWRAVARSFAWMAVSFGVGVLLGLMLPTGGGYHRGGTIYLPVLVLPLAVPIGVLNLLVAGVEGRSPWSWSGPVVLYGTCFLAGFLLGAYPVIGR